MKQNEKIGDCGKLNTNWMFEEVKESSLISKDAIVAALLCFFRVVLLEINTDI